jgi:pyroglutamyl-peptidase
VTTEFRTLIEVSVGDLLPTRGDLTELRVHSSGDTSRTQIRKVPAPCAFEGDPAGKKVLITGFQPFPADGWHENISAVAVTSLDPAALHGTQVMRLVLPVEYDRAAATIADVIDRCSPAAVISFGQGGGNIALEETAYNLQDTGELSGGAPDNRGIIRAAVPIALDAPPTRETLLPLTAIENALVDLGEAPQRSQDPGRYICNNVMFVNLGKMAFRGVAGFIHLPYTTTFDDAARSRWGKVAEAAVQATVDAP